MWNITSGDVDEAKDRLERRRAAVEARYAEDRQALDGELAVIETLERAAAEFVSRYPREAADISAQPNFAAGIGIANGDDEGGARDIPRPGSRWRLHLGNRTADGEVTLGGTPSAPM